MILNSEALHQSWLRKGRGGKALQLQQRACKSGAQEANDVLDAERPRCKLHRIATGRKSGVAKPMLLSSAQDGSPQLASSQRWQWEEEPSPSSGHTGTEGHGLRLRPAFLLCCTEPSTAPVTIAAVPLHHLQVETEQAEAVSRESSSRLLV